MRYSGHAISLKVYKFNMKSNVKGLPGLHITEDGQAYHFTPKGWVNIKLCLSKSKNRKYKRVYVVYNNKLYSLSRLVAKVYIPNIHNKPYVGHKDNDPTNNHKENLYWCTQSENVIKAFMEGRRSANDVKGPKNPYYRVFGEQHSVSKYSNQLKIDVYKYYLEHPNITVSQLQTLFNIRSSRSVRKIIHKVDPIIISYLNDR